MKKLCLFAVLALSSIPALADEIIYREWACRVMDTRLIGGQIPALTEYEVNFRGSNAGQGGQSNCTVPEGATGAVIVLAAVGASSNGWVKMYPHGGGEPLSTVLITTALENENNGLIVRFGSRELPHDATIKALFSAHYVIDLVGYTMPVANRTAAGEIADKVIAVMSDPNGGSIEVVKLTLEDGSVVVCSEPYMNPDTCDVFVVGDCISARGHLAGFYGLHQTGAHEIFGPSLAYCQ